MKRENKTYIIILLMITILLLTYGIKYISKSKNEELPEVKLKEKIEKEKTFAIMVQENSTKDKYQEYKENTWPGDDYKFKEAKCVDNNGSEIKEAITYTDGKITLIANKTIYCTLYFDKSIIGKLRENEELANKDNLSKDLQGGMYRYQGTDDVRNWICFGTTDNCGTNDDLIDKYMYRIIGITEEGQLYLVKETFLKEGSTPTFKWNISNEFPDCLGYACEWPNADLYKRLNGIMSNGNPIFIDNSYYKYMTKNGEWYNLIEKHNWMYGDTNEVSTVNKYNGDAMYEIEHGDKETTHYVGTEDNITQETYTWSEKVNSKINLMYLHDYYYSYYDRTDESTRGNAGSSSKLKNSWLFFEKDGYNISPSYEWLSTRWGVKIEFSTIPAYIVNYSGVWVTSGLTTALGVRPVFYLSSKAKIVDGDGTKAKPYILEV